MTWYRGDTGTAHLVDLPAGFGRAWYGSLCGRTVYAAAVAIPSDRRCRACVRKERKRT